MYFICFNSFGQKIHRIYQGGASDSSFYHIEKITSNEFWVGGEYGILKKVDSLGVVSNIEFPNDGQHILKIQKIENNIYLLTDNALIYKYNIQNQSFTKKHFPAFHNKCFYDMIPLKNGQIMICGGSKGISKAKKQIPRGFIAITDSSLNELTVVWKSYRKFVWSLVELEDNSVLAATFNGFNTTVIKKSDASLKWIKASKVKGLVHELKRIDDAIWYSGTPKINYKGDGLFGKMGDSSKLCVNTGCLWSMDQFSDQILAVTTNGDLLGLDLNSLETKYSILQTQHAMYDLEKVSEFTFLVVGQNKNIYLVDLKK
jgi:hypothetical protein